MTSAEAPQDRPPLEIDIDDLETARRDPVIHATLEEARAYGEQVMAEGRDRTGVGDIAQHLGASEETIRRWQDEGLIHATTLPAGSLRRVTPEDVDRMATEGTLYGPFPREIAEAAIKAAQEEKPEPPHTS